MPKMYFVISDIHGHYDELLRDLDKSGFDRNNLSHHLIVLGDMFDRGEQSKEVFEYLFILKQDDMATIILGNHDSFFIEFLERKYSNVIFNIHFNGFKKTLESFIGRKLSSDEDWDQLNQEIKRRFIHLYNFMKELPLYYEIGDYIFVHGGIKYNDGDWRNNSQCEFIWSYEINLERVPNKIVVAGHHRVATIRYPSRNYEELIINHPEAFNILYEEGKILIDAFVEISKKINVLRLEL